MKKNTKGSQSLKEKSLQSEGKYIISNLHQLPLKFSALEVLCKQDEKTYAFFGETNPLSNFYPCKFTLDNVKYHSTEQFIQSQKAKHYEDPIVGQYIMLSITALEVKRLSKEINTYGNY